MGVCALGVLAGIAGLVLPQRRVVDAVNVPPQSEQISHYAVAEAAVLEGSKSRVRGSSSSDMSDKPGQS